MKVKRTYGRQKTVEVEGSLWNKSDNTFDRLLLDDSKKAKTKLSAKDKIRVSFNRDSSLDESKVRKSKSKKAPKKQAKKSAFNLSHDELYEMYLKDKKTKRNLRKKQTDSVRNVQVSTPVQKQLRQKKVADLQFALSPITLNDSSQVSMDNEMEDLRANIRRQRLKEMEEAEKALETTVTRQAKAWLAKHKTKEPLKSSENLRQNKAPTKDMPKVLFLTSPSPRPQPKLDRKTVRFSVALDQQEGLALRPGKWRRSLIAWRTSQHTIQPNRMSTLHSSNRSEETSKGSKEESLNNSVLLEQSDDGNLHAALSILDASIKCAATFHDQRKTSQRKTSVFQRTSIFYGLQEPLIDADPSLALSARQIALRRCGQQEPLPFNEIYSESQLPNCCKIGEGVYGEVFMYKCPTTQQPIVLKIIPIEGDQLINGEPQKRFDEILQEIVISMELSGMRNGKDYATDGFVNVKRVTCVKGAYPEHLIDEWELYRDNRIEGSDNDHPGVFQYDQLYVVFELCNGGRDLEAFVFKSAEEAQSVFLQTALTLAVAERKFEFEHRDLHWGNILIAPTTDKFAEFRVDGKLVKLLTHGVKATIIDYSLSRMVYDGAVLYDNLARDEELFQSTGDYQFDIYRLMRERVENNFERYEPYTNLLWLHYMVDKLINGARYRYSKTKKHRAAINEMMQERDELLNYTSATDYIGTLEL